MSRCQIQAMLVSMYPHINHYHGFGYDFAIGRYRLTPHSSARIMIVDGTTSGPVSNVYHVASIAAAKALCRQTSGDWILLPQGQTTTGLFGELGNGTVSFSGVNQYYPFVVGTFDPADAENRAKWNRGAKHVIDATGLGKSSALMISQRAPRNDQAIVGIHFLAGPRDETSFVSFLGAGRGILLDGCVFDGVFVNLQGKFAPAPSGAMDDQLDADLLNDVTANRCGFLYANSYDSGRNGLTYNYMGRRPHYQQCLLHHGGWSSDHTRDTPPWNPGPSTAVSSLTQSGGTATATIASTAGLVVGGGGTPYIEISNASPSGYNYTGYVTVINGTQYTYPVSSGLSSPATVANTSVATTILYRDTGANGFDHAVGAGADQFKHSWYFADYISDVYIWDCISSWDASNAKFTGGRFHVWDLTEVRNPMGFIFDSMGNLGNPVSFPNPAWPTLGPIDVRGHLQLESDDMTTFASGARGQGPSMYRASQGSIYDGGVLLNQSNSQAVNRRGIFGDANGGSIQSYVDVRNSIAANWAWSATDTSVQANTTKSYARNIWDSASSGTNLNRAGMASSGLKTAITAALARNVHTTFRIEQNIPVTVDADDKVTEDRVLAYMARNPTMKNWNRLLRAHTRGLIGV